MRKNFSFRFIGLILILLMFLGTVGCVSKNPDLFESIFKSLKGSLASLKGADGIPDYTIIEGTEVTVSQGEIPDGILIRWSKLEKATSYVLYRLEAAPQYDALGRVYQFKIEGEAVWERLKHFDGEVVSFKDSTVNTTKGYCYLVKPLCRLAGVDYEGPVSYPRLGWAFPPISQISATRKVSTHFIEVSWQSLPCITGYEIYRGQAPLVDEHGESLNPQQPVVIDGNSYTKIATTLSTVYEDLSALESGPKKNILYFYKVVAINEKGKTPLDEAAVAKGEILPPGAIPPPLSVLASRGLTGEISISWQKVGGTVEYAVYRSPFPSSSGSFAPEKMGKTSSLSYTDNHNLEENRHYYYYVSCINNLGDEGQISIDFPVENAPDTENCSFTNEGYILATPQPNVVLLAGVNDSSKGAILVNWKAVEGAESYEYSSDKGNSFQPIDSNQIFIESQSLDSQVEYQVRAINRVGGSENKSALSMGVKGGSFLFTASQGAFIGSGQSTQGAVNLSYTPLFREGITSATLKKKPFFRSELVELSLADLSSGSFSDTDHEEILYNEFCEKFRDLKILDGETADQAAIRLLSNEYQIEIVGASDTYRVTTKGWRMFTPKEALYLFKMADHTSSNHCTNQISGIHGAPNYLGSSLAGNYFPAGKETDQAYYSGTCVFDAYHPPTISQQYALIAFRYTDCSDYPGVVLRGDTFVFKDKGSGKLNNTEYGQNPTIKATLFNAVDIALEERLDIDRYTSAVLAGTSTITVTFSGEVVYKVAWSGGELLAFFGEGGALKDSTANCPGGRNFKRGSAESTGHYSKAGALWIDPDNCGPRALLKEPDSVEALADPDL